MNWSEYDVPALASMLADNYADAWDQVLGWQVVSVTIDASRQWLATARAQLAEAWPPEHSPAAVAFLSYLDGLDTSMADTANVALTNGSARATVLTVLGEAHRSVDQLHQTWKARVVPAQPLATAAARFAAESAAAKWAADLNTQAHEVMTKTDQAIFESYRQLQIPEVYGQPSPIDPRTQIPIPGGATSPTVDSESSPRSISGQSTAQTSILTPSSSHPSEHGLPATESVNMVGSDGSYPADDSGHFAVGNGIDVAGAGAAIAGGLLTAGLKGASMTARIGPALGSIGSSGNTRGRGTSAEPSVAPESSARTVTAGEASQESTGTSTGSLNAESGGMLAPGMGAASRPAGRSSRHRLRGRDPRTTPSGVASLLTAHDEEPIYHDPGPGVIGIDR